MILAFPLVAALYAMSVVRSVPLPFRYPLIAFFPCHILAIGSLLIVSLLGYDRYSYAYEWVYTAGIIGVLVMTLMSAVFSAIESKLWLLVPIGIAAAYGGWLSEQVARVWYTGVPFSMHLLTGQVVILYAAGLMAVFFARLKIFRILGAFWILLGFYDALLLSDVLNRGTFFAKHSAYIHATLTTVCFSAIGFFRGKPQEQEA